MAATAKLPSYTYQKLSRSNATKGSTEIRLVEILPGQVNAPLECKIATVDLAEDPEYEALSYTWGTGGLSCEVRIRGTKPPTELPITTTLYSTMQRLRFKYRTRRIWIDQICINLTDTPERNHQVRFMKNIYWRAKRVVIDLGDGTEQSDRVFDYAVSLDNAACLENDWHERRIHILPQKLPVNVVQSIADILLRPWFQRVWVIQETILASDILVCCGSRTITWSQLFVLVNHSFNIPDWLRPWADSPFKERTIMSFAIRMVLSTTMRRNRHGVIEPIRMAVAVVNHRNAQATDPRDKIFSLLGVATDDVTPEIDVDYSKPVSLVYCDFAKIALERGEIYLLNHAGVAQASVLDLPSWVPDWSRAVERHTFDELEYQASGPGQNERCYISASANSNIIYIKVGVVDEMKFSGEALPEPFDDNDFTAFAHKGQEVIRGLDRYPTGEEVLEAYCRTIVGGRLGSHRNEWLKSQESYCELYTTTLLEIEAGRSPSHKNMYMANVRAGRRFCTTKNEYMGLVPKDVREGDAVCIVFGANTPFVLRKQEDTYCLVGECYIHGLMNGEALGLEHFKWEWLPLR